MRAGSAQRVRGSKTNKKKKERKKQRAKRERGGKTTAPAAPSRCPIFPLLELRSKFGQLGKASATALLSTASPCGVDVAWQLM